MIFEYIQKCDYAYTLKADTVLVVAIHSILSHCFSGKISFYML